MCKRKVGNVKLKKCISCKRPWKDFKTVRSGHCSFCWNKVTFFKYLYFKNKCACGNFKMKTAKRCWKCVTKNSRSYWKK